MHLVHEPGIVIDGMKTVIQVEVLLPYMFQDVPATVLREEQFRCRSHPG